MTPSAIVLVLLSAVLHASWNTFSKRSGSSPALFFVIAFFGALLTLPVVAWHWAYLPELPAGAWYRLIATGLAQAIYFFGLGGAYRHGHISIAYPIARALPVILVAAIVYLFGGGTFTVRALVGMACIVSGCILVPMLHMRDLRLTNYWNLSLAFVLVAAIGTTGYTLIDDATLRLLREDPAWTLSNARTATLYMGIEASASFLWMIPLVLSSAARRAETLAVWKNQKRSTAMNAFFMICSYTLILVSYTLATNVGYIAAFRQAAIPIGAALGIVWMREPLTRPKVMGLALLTAGLVLVAIY
jgi:drug/metabolite transporter (DMT)-like permease